MSVRASWSLTGPAVRAAIEAMTSTEHSPKQVVRRYLDALLAGEVEAIRASFAEDATWTIYGDLPIAGPWVGRDRIVDDFLSTVGGSLFEPGSQSFEFPSLIAEGDTVALESRVRARTARGSDYDNVYCGIFVVRDGQICAVREYLDSHYAAETLLV
jgi:ketosteroid isomerase-like protein